MIAYGYYGYSIGSYSESIVGSKFHEVFIFMVSAIAYIASCFRYTADVDTWIISLPMLTGLSFLTVSSAGIYMFYIHVQHLCKSI